ncbi:TIGR01548 family HAD-type hydrolase [Roseofilum casamattae]|uniref:TIGR01548 family HAD-type hydrolase n=1 Tax=Roseofilum casamattae BLCC-M143 TaxID=3022442 RepID=A0ABT7BUS0_9CYAN|nr:TIGR01548 family HAD-type hydrolase [Roseofilum casamattae]MDJ1182926.1 TIGR01548 family HAD-type hydrolase [Roseofilum casamattae BLCC-M143]
MNPAKSRETKAIAIFDIDGVIRDVGGSYRRAIADTVNHFTDNQYCPTLADIDRLKSEGIWNNDWEASRELIYRYWESQERDRQAVDLDYEGLVEFFQSRYQGTAGDRFNGYIVNEPLLVSAEYFQSLTQEGVLWGFFSGAMRAEAKYALEYRLGLSELALIAMEDAPGKPDPTGLFQVIEQLGGDRSIPVFYVGDTVADMKTIARAQAEQPERTWIAIGVLPPHVQESTEVQEAYTQQLYQAGARQVLRNVEELTVAQIDRLA